MVTTIALDQTGSPPTKTVLACRQCPPHSGTGCEGHDAVHCAAALAVAEDDLVAASGDRELLSAWREDGLAVVDTNA